MLESRKPKGFSLSDMTLVYYPSNPDEFDYLEGWKIDKVPDDPYYIESIEDLFHADEGDETFVLDANDVCSLHMPTMRACAISKKEQSVRGLF